MRAGAFRADQEHSRIPSVYETALANNAIAQANSDAVVVTVRFTYISISRAGDVLSPQELGQTTRSWG